MKNLVGKFSFKVPEDSTHADAGKKIEKAFEYQECENDAEAQRVMTHDSDGKERKTVWSLVELVNDVLKANARSNAYQSATIVYKPSDVSPAEIKERMIRDYIRLNIPEDVARKQVEALLAASEQ